MPKITNKFNKWDMRICKLCSPVTSVTVLSPIILYFPLINNVFSSYIKYVYREHFDRSDRSDSKNEVLNIASCTLQPILLSLLSPFC